MSKITTETPIKKPKVKREKSTSTKGHYVTNATLLPAVLEAKALGKVTDSLIKKIQLIAERYSRKSNFIRYTFREDMVSAAVMNLCNNALKFNPEKSSNPFSFYTTAIHNSFLQYMADEKKHRNIRDALLIDAGSNPSFNFMQGEKDEHHFEVKESDEIYVNVRNQVYDDGTEQIVPLTVSPESDAEQPIPLKHLKRESKIGYTDRIPGEVTRWKAKEVSIAEDGSLILKPKKEVKAKVIKPAYRKSVLTSLLDKKTPAPRKVTKKPTATAK